MMRRTPLRAEKPIAARSTFTQLIRTREFRWLWLADAQSQLGDQLARVALAILIYDRTHSELATAAAYALTFLPALAGNLTLGVIADRLPRRRVLVAGDLIRSVFLAAMTLPGLPIGVLMALLSAAVFVGAPWAAAETALITDIVEEQEYAVGLGLRAATLQSTQLIGFAVGGVAVGILGARLALGVDAATFVVSAVVIRLGVRVRPGAAAVSSGERWFSATAAVFGDRRLRLLLGFSSLLGLIVIPEGLAAPYAKVLGGGAATVGLLLASVPTGVLLGSVVFSRWAPDALRARLLGPLAVLSGLPLLASVLTRNLPLTMALWALSGASTAYQVQVMTEYVKAVVPERRGQAIGVASAGLLAAQGVGLLAGGAMAQLLSASAAIGIAGFTASTCAAVLTVRRSRSGPLAQGLTHPFRGDSRSSLSVPRTGT